ncbi:TraR/DksA family transcriptional regulator [uncultured Deefgea sp.]|uniref:TraR/DksA family transcriptional regulator n=1 Tax=uncultured Deefgea sp. TaxID=1304914 RepID=UPI0026120727|nr:TraR/DksA family transcriptional regulator [uncultured Deefgea sp.]
MTDIFDRASEQEQWLRDQALAQALAHEESTIISLGCHDCGEPLSEARREAVPHCTRCVECQTDFETRKNR